MFQSVRQAKHFDGIFRTPRPSEESGWCLTPLLEPMIGGGSPGLHLLSLGSGAVGREEGITIFPSSPEPRDRKGQVVCYQNGPADELQHVLGVVPGPFDATRDGVLFFTST